MRVLIVLAVLMISCNEKEVVEIDTGALSIVDIPDFDEIVEFYESYSADVACTDSVTAFNVYRLRTKSDTLYVLEPCTDLYWTPRRIRNADRPLWLLDDGPPPGNKFVIPTEAKIPTGARCAFGTVKALTM